MAGVARGVHVELRGHLLRVRPPLVDRRVVLCMRRRRGLEALLQLGRPLHQVLPGQLPLARAAGSAAPPLGLGDERGRLLGVAAFGASLGALELDGERLPLVHRALDLLDEALLLAVQGPAPQVHAVDLLLHGVHLAQPHVGVQRGLGLLLELDLLLPQQQLPLGLHDLVQHLVLLLGGRPDLALHLSALLLQALELAHEVQLQNAVRLGQLALLEPVLPDELIQTRHVRLQRRRRPAEALDLGLGDRGGLDRPEPLLGQNGDARPELVVGLGHVLGLGAGVHQGRLVPQPVPLQRHRLVGQVRDLLLKGLDRRLEGPKKLALPAARCLV
mmetsp:Transcript_65023/g.146699  ORF Transcript_65023/g.146699 Transcript_65023/m.146699 type:complete len:330 (-) Transcript_65023:1455-2444(-)